jgi:DNA polymerase
MLEKKIHPGLENNTISQKTNYMLSQVSVNLSNLLASWDDVFHVSLCGLVSDKPISVSVNSPVKNTLENKMNELLKLHASIKSCIKCELHKTRANVVCGAGSISSKIMFVGEAPGQDEDIKGLPFVGKAGKLLSQLLLEIGVPRDSVFITNIVKCRPPNNRPPDEIEILTCQPYLKNQIELLKPKIVVTLGSYATQSITGSLEGITKLRSREIKMNGFAVFPTFHPAYVLRNPKSISTIRADFARIIGYI